MNCNAKMQYVRVTRISDFACERKILCCLLNASNTDLGLIKKYLRKLHEWQYDENYVL